MSNLIERKDYFPWIAEEEEIFNQHGVVIPGYKNIFRSDNFENLGIVTNRYHTLSNMEFEDVADRIISEGLASYHAHGEFTGGKKLWIQFESDLMPNDCIGKWNDAVKSYLLLVNGHAGSLKFGLVSTTVRVVCMNTFNIALSRGDHMFSFKHSKSLKDKVKLMHEQIVDLGKATKDVYSIYQRMAEEKFEGDYMKDFAQLMDYHKKPRPINKKQENGQFKTIWWTEAKYSTKANNNLADLKYAYENEPEIMGTNWGMFNAVTHYVDHLNEHKDGTDYAAFGNGHLLKSKAFARYGVE